MGAVLTVWANCVNYTFHFISDFADQADEDQLNALGFQLLGGSRVTLLASKTSRKYLVELKLWMRSSHDRVGAIFLSTV